MKDEIKEILDNIKTTIDEGHYRATCDIDYEDCKLLYDYIIKINKKYNEAIECIDELKNEVDELNKICDLYGKSLYNAETENERLKEINKEQANHLISKENLSYEDYKSRIEKAVEYIKKHLCATYFPSGCGDVIKYVPLEFKRDYYENGSIFTETENLLNILNGRSDE